MTHQEYFKLTGLRADVSDNQAILDKLIEREVVWTCSNLVQDNAEKLMDLRLWSQLEYEGAATDEGWEWDVESCQFINPESHSECTVAGEEDWQGLCDFEGIEPHEREALEHWIVSGWFAGKLAEQGELVDEACDFHI